MVFTKKQLSEQICKHTKKENSIFAILREQKEECERLAGTLYTKGLTQELVGEVFNDIYEGHYSKASISRMLNYLRLF